MEKTRRMLYLPLAYHVALLLAMTIMFLLPMKTGAFGFLFLLDMAGVLISPMFMALMGISHAILHDGKVFDYAKQSIIYLVVIGLTRVILYAVQTTDSFAMTLIMGAMSVGIYVLWATIFTFTDKLMKKKTKPWHKKGNRK